MSTILTMRDITKDFSGVRALGDRVFQMIKSIAAGEEVEVNDTETYDNGEKVVPSYLLDPQVVVKDDVQTLLIDSGFLKAADVGL